MWREITVRAAEFSENASLRVLIVRGEGMDAYAAGADITQFSEVRNAGTSSNYDADTEEALLAIATLAKPVISAVRGYCMGGGVSIALATDIRLGDTTALFSLPPARLGIAYPTGSLARLVREVGASNARYLLFTAERIDATRAAEMGILHEVHSPDQLQSAVTETARRLLELSPMSIRASKIGIATLAGTSPEQHAVIEELSRACLTSADYQEGIRAFEERRKPHFKGV